MITEDEEIKRRAVRAALMLLAKEPLTEKQLDRGADRRLCDWKFNIDLTTVSVLRGDKTSHTFRITLAGGVSHSNVRQISDGEERLMIATVLCIASLKHQGVPYIASLEDGQRVCVAENGRLRFAS